MNVRDYTLGGTLGEKNISTEKERIVFFLESMAREDGFVPVLDMEPVWDLEYDHSIGAFRFELSLVVHKLEEGKDPWDYSGISKNILIPKSTQTPK